MTPRLVLLTGPAAGEVYRVLLRGCPLYPAGHPVNEKDGHWWDEVRDYWAAPLAIRDAFMDHSQTVCRDEEAGDIEAAIRSLPGGEAWLVGLVLPALPETVGRPATSFPWNFAVHHRGQPARLAILAPEPPPLLVERVRAWGGQIWECTTDHEPHSIYGKKPCGITARNTGFGDTFWDGNTWPEAVRAALGEVAP